MNIHTVFPHIVKPYRETPLDWTPVKFGGYLPTSIRMVALTYFNTEKWNTSKAVTPQNMIETGHLDDMHKTDHGPAWWKIRSCSDKCLEGQNLSPRSD